MQPLNQGTTKKSSPLLFVIAITLILIGIVMFIVNSNTTFIETQAYVTDVERDYTDDSNKYNATIKYDVGSETYTGMMSVGSDVKEGDFITIYYSESDPTFITNSSDGTMYIILIVAGVVTLVIGIVSRKNEKTQNSSFASPIISKAPFEEDPSESFESYSFYFCGPMNQNYVMKDESKTSVYEANLKKYHLFAPSTFEFKNLSDLTTTTYEVSQTVTYRSSTGVNHFSWTTDLSSYFFMNKQNVWEILSSKGYTLLPTFSGMKMSYQLFDDHHLVAKIETGDTSLRTGKKGLSIPVPGIYNIQCKESDIDIVFLVAFIVTKVEWF